MRARPPQVVAVFAIYPGFRVGVRLSDGTKRVTVSAVLDLAGVAVGSPWPPVYDKSGLVLKEGDPGFA